MLHLAGPVVVGTNRELTEPGSRPFHKRQLVLNVTTGELRQGPGLWHEMKQPFGMAVADITVEAATTTNITIATALNAGDELDGIMLSNGDRVLVKDQTAPSQNGIYIVGDVPARDPEFADIPRLAGVLVAISQGMQSGHTFLCVNDTAGVIGTTAVDFVRKDLGKLDLTKTGQVATLPAPAALADAQMVMVEQDGHLKGVTLGTLKAYINA